MCDKYRRRSGQTKQPSSVRNIQDGGFLTQELAKSWKRRKYNKLEKTLVVILEISLGSIQTRLSEVSAVKRDRTLSARMRFQNRGHTLSELLSAESPVKHQSGACLSREQDLPPHWRDVTLRLRIAYSSLYYEVSLSSEAGHHQILLRYWKFENCTWTYSSST